MFDNSLKFVMCYSRESIIVTTLTVDNIYCFLY